MFMAIVVLIFVLFSAFERKTRSATNPFKSKKHYMNQLRKNVTITEAKFIICGICLLSFGFLVFPELLGLLAAGILGILIILLSMLLVFVLAIFCLLAAIVVEYDYRVEAERLVEQEDRAV
jgi:Flp pilus assembly protein TadB